MENQGFDFGDEFFDGMEMPSHDFHSDEIQENDTFNIDDADLHKESLDDFNKLAEELMNETVEDDDPVDPELHPLLNPKDNDHPLKGAELLSDKIKLDSNLLLSKNGLPKLRHMSKKFKIKQGKGSEFENLQRLMLFYQIWAHELYPKIKFNSFINRTEKLCKEKRMRSFFKVALAAEKSSRLDNYLPKKDLRARDMEQRKLDRQLRKLEKQAELQMKRKEFIDASTNHSKDNYKPHIEHKSKEDTDLLKSSGDEEDEETKMTIRRMSTIDRIRRLRMQLSEDSNVDSFMHISDNVESVLREVENTYTESLPQEASPIKPSQPHFTSHAKLVSGLDDLFSDDEN